MPIPLSHELIRDFSTGMITEVADSLTPPNAMRLIQNLDDEVLGMLRVRKGVTAIGNQITDGKPCLGLYNFRDSGTGSNNQQIAAFNDSGDSLMVTSYLSGASWATITGSFTADAIARFETFTDYVFTVNSKFDAPKSWNGGTPTWGTTQLSGAPSGQFIKKFKSRLYIAHTATNPDRVFFSSIISSTGNISWTTSTDYLDVNPSDGMNITGIENNGTLLLIFKDRAMYRWNGSSTDADLVMDIGCSSNESIATRNGLTFFFNPKGIYQTDGGRPVRISGPIQRWIDAISPTYYSKVAGVVDGERYYCSVGDLTVEGVSYSNVVLVRNLANNTWSVRTYAEEMRRFAPYILSTGAEGIMCGNDDGDVQAFNSGLTDDGVKIPYRVLTKRMDFLGSFAHEKSFSEIHAFGKGLTGAQTIVHTEEDRNPKSFGTILKSWWMKITGLKNVGRWFVFELSGLSEDQTNGSEFWGWEIGNANIPGKGHSKGTS
jgi:hypothetical protein